MHARPISDSQRFAGAALLILGTSGMSAGLAFFAIRFGWGHSVPERPLAGAVVSCLVGLAGFRLASGRWSGSSQVPHHALALGSFIFLVALLYAPLEHHPVPATARIIGLAVCSVALIGSWYWRARRRRRRHRS